MVGAPEHIIVSYFPILSSPGCVGQTTLFNFPPNNWEDRRSEARFVNLTWAESGVWHSSVLDELAYGAMRTITSAEVSIYIPSGTLPFLSLSTSPLPEFSDRLPASMHGTNMPNWRATISLVSQLASTCYQGELDPFPRPGSLLTFVPFLQFGAGIENYLLLLNLEKDPQFRSSIVEIYDTALPGHLCGSLEVHNNAISIISLDGIGIGPETLPIIICKGMSAVPLYFSRTADSSYLSLEHTHPPASFVIHGKRWDAQRILKADWFLRLGQL